MSDTCEHNDHGHLLLWAFVLMLCFNSSCVDCSGEKAKQENRIKQLEYKVQQLESKK